MEMAINVIILFVCVLVLIVALCILSYLKLIFERLLDKDTAEAPLPVTSEVPASAILPETHQDDDDSAATEFSNEDKVAYCDATVAFQKLNNELYTLRKHKSVIHELFSIFHAGQGTVSQTVLADLADDDRENVVSALHKIKLFNESYRPALSKGLRALGLSFESNVRFPLNLPFDNSWDENVFGYDVDDGSEITRVVSLGYEFPESPIIGRQKAQVI